MSTNTYKPLNPSFQTKAESGPSINNLKMSKDISNSATRHLKPERKVSIDPIEMEKGETKINKPALIWTNKFMVIFVLALLFFFSMYTKHKINEYNKIKDVNDMIMKMKSMFASLYEMDEKVAKQIQLVENSLNVYQSSLMDSEITESQ